MWCKNTISLSRSQLSSASWTARLALAGLTLVVMFSSSAQAASKQKLAGEVYKVSAGMNPTGELLPTKQLDLAIALPLRNASALTNFLEELYSPTSTNFHRFLTSEEFTDRFGPTIQDYEEVKRFARSHRLEVIGTHANRTLLNVRGSVDNIQRAFDIVLRNYDHPTEARTFFAPNTPPQVDSPVPMLEICGLDDYVRAEPLLKASVMSPGQMGATPDAGSGPSGTYMGNDFRAAYIPGISLKGDGEKVGLFQLDGYYPNDPKQYAIQTGLTNSIALNTLSNILVGGFDGTPGGNNVEVALDIEMVMAMAPNAQILVYMGANYATGAIDVLNRMATDNLAKQLSASWSFPTGPATAQVFLQMASQGQSFFNSSGDQGAYVGTVTGPKDIPYITIVGGTTLSTTGPNGSRISEEVWHTGPTTSSGGGYSTSWPIPSWQKGINMTSNRGSTSKRNLPDVAMIANNVYAIAGNGVPFYLQGTSIAAPLWAAFTALVNQRASALGKSTVGFISPALYELGKSPTYTNLYYDVTMGDNTTPASPTNFPAVAGFDLCTGWGTPRPSLIDALVNVIFVPSPGWTPVDIPPDANWTSVSSSADGGIMVAAGGAQAYVSTTGGRVWRRRSVYVQSVTCSADGVKMAGTHFEVPIYVSTNTGADWVATATPGVQWGKIASSGDGSRLAAGNGSQNVVLVSTNSGATWFPTTMPAGELSSPSWSADGKVLVVAPRGSGFYVSTNAGITCSPATLPGLYCVATVISGDASRIVAVGNYSICISTNLGKTWQTTSAPAVEWTAVASSYDGFRLFATSQYGVFMSDNGGMTWTNTGPASGAWSGVACSADGTRVVAVSQGPMFTGFFPRSGPSVQASPNNQVALAGSAAQVASTTVGPGPMSYQWYFGGAIISGATNALLTFTNLQFSQSGPYSVQVSNHFGISLSAPVNLTVMPASPTILTQPADRVVALGHTGSFLVTAFGAPPLAFQWQRDTTNIPSATSAQLLIPDAKLSDSGAYRVVVSNAFGAAISSNASLLAIPPPSCVEPVPNLVGWWRAEGNAQSETGTNHGVLVGDVTNGIGKVGQAFVLDGIADVIKVGNLEPNGIPWGSVTAEMWVRRSSNAQSTRSGGSAKLLELNGGTSSLEIGNGGGLFFQHMGMLSFGGNVSDTGWHHVALVATYGSTIIYLDGVLVAASGAPQEFTPNSVAIGGAVSSSNSFYGQIDEPAIYSRALSATEIAAIHSAGIDGKCWLPEPPTIVGQPASITSGAGLDLVIPVTAIGRPPNFTFQWTRDGLDLLGETNSILVLANAQTNQTGLYAVKVTNPFGTALSSNATVNVLPAFPCTPLHESRVAWWRAENSSFDDVEALQASVHGVLTYQDGKVGRAFYFDGASSYLQAPAVSNLNMATGPGFTIESWIAPEGIYRQGIAGWNDNSSSFDGLGVMLEINNDGPGNLSAFFINADQGYIYMHSTNGLVKPNLFQHVALTFDRFSSQASLFYNGQIVASTQLPPDFEPQTHSDFCIGVGDAWGWLGGLFLGRIDETTVYRRALASAEIESIYQSAAAGKCTETLAFLKQPQSQTSFVGSSLTLEVLATSLSPINYRWGKGTNTLNQDTRVTGVLSNRLTITNLSLEDVGQYSVTISNELGMLISSNAIVSVQTPVPPVFTSIAVMADGSVSGTVTGFVGPAALEASTNLITWSKIASLTLTNNTATFVDSAATNFQVRFYRVRSE